uniref:Uncharacterized protein n=1 Tax=Meloidogyne enterolobii TaxID=390850 RepID=A0A6V7UV65_MELEN|nr:unnamed protein product [Meloidogyne enterolobii]
MCTISYAKVGRAWMNSPTCSLVEKLHISSQNDTWCPTKFTDNFQTICHLIELHELVLGKFGLNFSDHFGQSYGTQRSKMSFTLT